MAGQLGDYGEVIALNSVFRDGTLYIGLSTSIVGDEDTTDDINEVTDSSYSRKEISFDVPFQEDGKGTILNDISANFGPWDSNQVDPVTHAFITNSLTGTGDIVAYTELSSSKTPEADEIIILRDEDLKIQMN